MLESWTRQGFPLDLSEFIGKDENGDGYIDDHEAKIQAWRELPPVVRRAATVDGRPYALPAANAINCIIYRRDIVREVTGVDEPPKSWKGFLRMCQLVSRKEKILPDGTVIPARAGYQATTAAWLWLPWLWSAGGREFVQVRTAQNGQRHVFAKEELRPHSPEGEDLSLAPLEWRADFASEAGQKTMEFYWRLFWQKWIKDPKTGDPIDLTDQEVRQRKKMMPGGRVIHFATDEIFTGVVRGLPGDQKREGKELFCRGEVVFMIGSPAEAAELCQTLSPDQVGFMPFPSPTGRKRVANMQPYFWWCLNSALATESPEKRRAAFDLILSMTGDSYRKAEYRSMSEKYRVFYVDPDEARRFGMEEILEIMPEHWLRNVRDLKTYTHTEPFGGFWFAVSQQLLGAEVLGRMAVDRDFDYLRALKDAQNVANNRILAGRTTEEIEQKRPWAYAVFSVFIVFLIWMSRQFWRSLKKAYLHPVLPSGERIRQEGLLLKILPWTFVLPALMLVMMWMYYPLLQGGIMAFQDYKILADKPFVGLDNFIMVLTDVKFYKYLWITAKFVGVNLALGFVLPVVLALMLHEIPRGKLFLRMIYLLPQISSAMVIAFIWNLMYYPTGEGYLNSLLLSWGWIQQPLLFLQDAKWALLWVSLPSIWSGIGIGSLIYLAALKSIPEDLYEAAELDGAGFWQKLKCVTLPVIAPLVLINFVGTFIGLFKSMGNIFLMTGGGPGDETTVLSFAIWRDSFLYLKFGAATATAWVLAALLVSFTVLQLRILSRVEFRRAEE